MPTDKLIYFAESETPKSGIGAFGLDLQLFIAQLVTFVIVLLVLKKFVFPKLSETLEKRRLTLEKSLEQAKETEEALKSAQKSADEILKNARAGADESIKLAEKQVQQILLAGEEKANKRSEEIIESAKQQIEIDRQKLRDELKTELATLTASAVSIVLSEKIDSSADKQLIEKAIKEST